uniref:(Atlantic silverside) hypothetical protein n=2 Tax=Menidia menidia TaxID=238744 RepID=A0A8S4BPD2_9TELE|nr:unnamed protein product [Menidia menidia]
MKGVVMADLSSSGVLLLLWTAIMVPRASPQPPPPLSLPVQLSVVSPPWQLLALSQGEPGPLFYNSSPFSVSQSVFLLPPPGLSAAPGLKASFGPYSVTQLVPEPFRPASPAVRASLLSENVEREMDEGGREVFRVRALFRLPGDAGARGTCVLLHAFRETEQRRASCVTQPLGLCVVTLTLPGEWFQAQDQRPVPDAWQKKALRGRRAQSRRHGNHVHPLRARAPPPRSGPVSEADSHPDRPAAFRHQRRPEPNQIQLYYSSFSPEADLQLTQTRCEEESVAQSQRQMYHIRAVALPEQTEVKGHPQEGSEGCLGGQQAEELSVDSHVTVRYHRGPVLIGQPVRMSVSLRGNFSADFVVIRMKVKKGLVSMTAQRTLTSDQWTVSLERSQSSKHDVMTIVCHKPPTHQPPLQQQVVCLSVDGLRRSFGVAMTVAATWWVEYSGQSRLTGTAASAFSFSDRPIVGIVPVTESDQILNTAILTSRPVSLPVAVLAVGHDQKVSDVTSAVTCRSANENTVKVSSDCSAVFVDGSESGLGNTCAEVHFELGVLSGSVCLEVWAPSVPLQVLLTDPVLNAIDGWNLFAEERYETQTRP